MTFTCTFIDHLRTLRHNGKNTMGKAQKPVRRKDIEANSWYSYISFRKISLQGKSITCSKDLKIQLTRRYNTSELICNSKKKSTKLEKKEMDKSTITVRF